MSSHLQNLTISEANIAKAFIEQKELSILTFGITLCKDLLKNENNTRKFQT